MTTINKEIAKILEDHAKWFRGEADGKRADFRYADFRHADCQGADFRGVNFRYADFRGVNFQDADLRGANIDYSYWPLWCGSLDVVVDRRIAAQLAYHFCRLICDDPDYIAARNAVIDFANTFHRVNECGALGKIEVPNHAEKNRVTAVHTRKEAFNMTDTLILYKTLAEFGEALKRDCPKNDCSVYRSIYERYCEEYADYQRIKAAIPDLSAATVRALEYAIHTSVQALYEMWFKSPAVLKQRAALGMCAKTPRSRKAEHVGNREFARRVERTLQICRYEEMEKGRK